MKYFVFAIGENGGQFHTLKNLAAALSIEAAELQETMHWTEDSKLSAFLQNDVAFKQHVAEEVADVLIYALLLCNEIDVEPLNAIRAKLTLNEKKYPVDKSKVYGIQGVAGSDPAVPILQEKALLRGHGIVVCLRECVAT